MTYYFIGADSSAIMSFRSRLPNFDGSPHLENLKQLEHAISSLEGGAVFFCDYQESSKAAKDLVAVIRKSAPEAKIVYITEEHDAHTLKSHQKSGVGGDAYIGPETSQEDLSAILEGLVGEELPPAEIPVLGVENRLEDSAFNQFADFHALDAFKKHPKSEEINQLFKIVIKDKPKKALWQSVDALNAPKADEESGDSMSTNEKDLPSGDSSEIEIDLGGEESFSVDAAPEDDGLDLSLDAGEELSLGEDDGLSLDAGGDELSLGEISLDAGGDELSLDAGSDLPIDPNEELSLGDDDGLSLDSGSDDLSLDAGEELSLDEEEALSFGSDDELALDDSADEGLSLSEEPESEGLENLGELSFDEAEDAPALPEGDGLSLGEMDLGGDELSLSDDIPAAEGLSLGDDEGDALELGSGIEFSNDAMEKLKEIDAIMEYDASQVAIKNTLLDEEPVDELAADEELDLGAANDDIIDQPLVSDDLNLDSLDFGGEEAEVEEAVAAAPVEKKKKKETKPAREVRDHDLGQELKEISGAYSGEMERLQATISNLRADREELLAKIDKFEDEKVMQNRQTLTLRAELDEKKIELTIIRKKLNEELNEMKDRLKLFDEKRLILEEKNRHLMSELDKAAQKNKIDVKKVQMRERELEQKLELLKSDAETQIKNRDLKILELKRKIDAMEFDMESISQQEKRSVESRFELEDKLEKAIKTLRNAITVLEDETDRSSALSALKKNIDM